VIGTANYPYLDAPIDAIKCRESNVVYYSGDSLPSGVTAAPGDIAIVFINSDSGENQDTVEGNHGDRDASWLYSWHNGDQLENWIDLSSVKSVVFAHLPGQEAGDSLTDILFGDYSPSGHLPYSIPVAESDYPSGVSLVGFEFFQVFDLRFSRLLKKSYKKVSIYSYCC
jgi:beta-glucosidase